MEWVYRFLAGGLVIALFASIGDVLRPKGFAGLFGAAPSVALATLSLTLLTEGKSYAALEARSMALGAAALFLYLLVCLYLMAKRHLRAPAATTGALAAWAICALVLWSLFLR
jgi:uncharacterized membrane protein (GlpM family)